MEADEDTNMSTATSDDGGVPEPKAKDLPATLVPKTEPEDPVEEEVDPLDAYMRVR